jgi:hypothetical protein
MTRGVIIALNQILKTSEFRSEMIFSDDLPEQEENNTVDG